MTRDELIDTLVRRDNITFEEAYESVMECADAINAILEDNDNISPYQLYDLAAEILADELGLEPDYLDVVLDL